MAKEEMVKEEKKEEIKQESSNGNNQRLTLEDIKKLPPEKRIPALKRLEEERRQELELADRESKRAVDELKEEREKDEEEEKLNTEKEAQRKKTLEQEVESATGTGKPLPGGSVTYSNTEAQLRDFYAVTTKVKSVLPGVLERIASHTASVDDERFLDSYKNSMNAVRAETAYVSSAARQEFYSMKEQIENTSLYHQQSTEERQKKEES